MEASMEGKLETGPALNHAAPPRGAREKGLNMWGVGGEGVILGASVIDRGGLG